VAGGGYGGQGTLGSAFEPACRQTLRAVYLGTLLAAVALGRTPAVLTLIGGGVFRNPVELIWEAILETFDAVRPLAAGPLDVVLNGFNLSAMIDLGEILPTEPPPSGRVETDEPADVPANPPLTEGKGGCRLQRDARGCVGVEGVRVVGQEDRERARAMCRRGLAPARSPTD
jgi:hypothetical protein